MGGSGVLARGRGVSLCRDENVLEWAAVVVVCAVNTLEVTKLLMRSG